MKFPRLRLEPEKKEALAKLIGLVIAVFAVFTLISIVSYLIHWRADMTADALRNAAGSLGYRFGRFLVCDCFGLGSLAILVILTALSIRLVFHKWNYSLLKTTAMTLGDAFVAALVLAYVGRLAGAETLFGGGLGGHCGALIVGWGISAMGVVVTGLVLAVLVVGVALVSSPRFVHWLGTIGTKEEGAGYIEPGAVDLGVQTDPNPAPVVVEPEPEPESEPEPEPVMADSDRPSKTPDQVGGDAKEDVIPGSDRESSEPGDPELEVIEGEGLETDIHKELPRIDNRLDMPYGLPNFKFPPLELLETYEDGKHVMSSEELGRNKNQIIATLRNYKIEITDIKAVVGPTVTLYKVTPAPGIKISAIKNLQDDIAMAMNAKGVRVVTLQDSVGIEVANDSPSIVPLRGLLNDDNFRNTKFDLPVALGYTITQQVKVVDLAKAPHLLVAGATQQGKSVCLNVIIGSLLYSKHPSELKLVFIDPKMVEFTAYNQLLKHYLAVLPDAEDEEAEKAHAIVKTAKDAEKVLRSLCIEMDDRYILMAKAGVNKLTDYNNKFKDRKLNPEHGHRYLPYLVTIVDEYADLTMTTGASPEAKAASRSITNSIIRLAQKGRAAGLHVILATQRPSVDVISGIIKSNFPMRIAFRTSSRIDSQTIIDAPGAEKLIGRGDMLFSAGIENERIQCGLIESEEVRRVTDFIGEQTKYGQSYNTPYYLPIPKDDTAGGEGGAVDVGDLDERFEEAARLVVTSQKASTSFLQTRLAMGFAKASRVMSQLEDAGIIGPQDGAKPRQVLVPDLDTLDQMLH
ncbi:MAG: DNA translocase FtsK 4TM domain-containing protein [Bacteroidales bacterium]|nr:DNA translocase FtsK 4TM domain-containing protein [Bacteroidales bacterium]